MPFVLDNSVTVSWAFEDETIPFTNYVLAKLRSDFALAPAIWTLEVGKALLSSERRGRLQPADTARFIGLIRSLPVRTDDTPVERAIGAILDPARKQNLTTYDASCVELALRESLPLATQDERLRNAARSAGVPLLEPTDEERDSKA